MDHNELQELNVNELHYLARLGRSGEVRSLVNGGVDPDVKNPDNQTPLMFAAFGSHREVVELLISSGADIHCSEDFCGWAVLHFAAYGGEVKIVQSLLSLGVNPNVKNFDGHTPLMVAVQFGKKEVAELLINMGADIHCCDNNGWTGLHHATYKGLLEIVKCLVNKGAALNKKVCKGQTPLMIAAKMLCTSQMPYKEIIELLINCGADIHGCDDHGQTVLHQASYRGVVDIVQILVNKGVALNVKECEGETPLTMAAQCAHTEVVELLINCGADIHCCNGQGWSLLHFASSSGMVKLVQSLVNEGIDPCGKDCNGKTPLMLAARTSQIEVVELLTNLGVDIHCCDGSGSTVLHYACEEDSVDTVKCLLNKGVAINIKNSCGKTPLYFAIERERIEVANYLLNAGADCNLEDNEGQSPFNILVKKRMHIEIIKLCIEKGAYVKATDYNNLLEDPLLKKVILQDSGLCSQAIINKFNNKDLPLFYKKLASNQKFPLYDIIKIRNRSEIVLEVEQSVASEIQAKGFCNVLEMIPLVLSILSVKSFLENSVPAGNRENLLESQTGLKRSGCNTQEHSCKKICN